ncbi:Acetyltransferase (GNAT) family protein [Micromonospora coriariae]|uniref:Acetyltransferase (GNAT) family protein n=1 Tax=Micromonospora coriariae TaxID=285665 RepID=A0A1C4VSF0_9ACTN|nr:GNAT family N-acetyltransferase [Micromonospora coriariae]SCE86741.1 Acetyltransferase (GNAT) family protein [Micromonospora coriariae]
MTTIRIAHSDEIPGLVQYPNDAERNAATGTYLTDLLSKGCTRPEWCLVAEDDGRLVGSVVLWTMPGNEMPIDVVLLEAPWDDPDLTIGLALLAEAATLARTLGATELGHVVDSPAQAPQFQRHPEEHAELLRRAGFTVARDGRRFRWLAGGELPAQDGRLRFRSLAELGPEPFVHLLETLLAETADARLTEDVRRHGLRKAAELLFEESAELDHEPQWWEIGYDADGTQAVISLPAHSPAFPVIGFVGVAPAHRGKGYSSSVVARGTAILAENGATEIRGDCDVENVAMFKGFQRAGYDNFANRMEFTRPL